MATVNLKPEEALVLVDFLLRFRDKEELSVAHPAEANALWDLCAVLENQVPELADDDYAVKLDAARVAVSDPNWE